jgi:hypothetical protein
MGEQRDFKVGDVVAWADVPDGALVLEYSIEVPGWWHVSRRVNGRGVCVGNDRHEWNAFNDSPRGFWEWNAVHHAPEATIVAVGITGHEDSDTLRTLTHDFLARVTA